MDALEFLAIEHEIIKKVLAALESYGAKVGGGERVTPGDLGRFAMFFAEFTDGCHHGKEERLLFPALEASGLPPDFGPIARLREEHDEGRSDVIRLNELAAGEASWTTWDRENLVQTIRGYAALLHEHIRKEEHVLFPLAAARLSEERLLRLGREFEEFEERETGEGAHARLHRLAEELTGRYLEAALAPAPHPPGAR